MHSGVKFGDLATTKSLRTKCPIKLQRTVVNPCRYIFTCVCMCYVIIIAEKGWSLHRNYERFEGQS